MPGKNYSKGRFTLNALMFINIANGLTQSDCKKELHDDFRWHGSEDDFAHA